MPTLTYHVATTLDGFIAAVDDSWSAFLSHGQHIPDYLATLDHYGSVVMGRRTYEAGLAHGVTNPYPRLATYVCSRALGVSPDPAVTIVDQDAVAFVRALKQTADRPIYLCGGGRIAAALIEAGLIDAIILKQNPVILGTGVPVFAGPLRATRLTLRDCRVYPTGVIVSAYLIDPG
jgi:dihydrofolate reductase